MKRPYETMFLLPPTMNENNLDEFIGKSKDLIGRKSGEVSEVQRMGVRKTAYQVNKSSSAYYVLIKYNGTGETVHELERMFKNSDEVWKFLTTKVTDKPMYAPKKVKKKDAKVAVEASAPAASPAVAAPATEPAKAPEAPKE